MQVANIVQSSVVRKLPSGGVGTKVRYIVGTVLVVVLGVATGWILSGSRLSSRGAVTPPQPSSSETEAGILDESRFTEKPVEGTLEAGGLQGEGTHRLVRDDNPTHNVYLTSTVIDLDSYVGKKVMIWGETLAAQEAPWLMDVGKIKVLQ